MFVWNESNNSFTQKYIEMNTILFFSVFLIKICYAMPQLQLVNVVSKLYCKNIRVYEYLFIFSFKIFRHGDRTPSYKGRFPTDPNYESDFHPIGFGRLTNVKFSVS